MAFDLDGLAALRAIASHPEVFAGIEAEAAKIARTLLTKLLRDKATGLPQARAMASALPAGTLAHVTDAMTDSEVATLATRLDKLNPVLKTADRQVRASLIAELVAGRAEPVAKPAGRGGKAPTAERAPRKAPSSGVEAAKKVLNSRAMGARKAVGKAAGA